MIYAFIQLVDLLQCKAFCLEDAEVYEDGAEEAASTPDKEDFGLKACGARPFVNKIRCCVADSPVEQPVASDGAGDGFCAEAEGKVLGLEW